VSNLTLACRPCNQEKGNDSLENFFKTSKRVNGKSDRMEKVLKKCKTSLRDANAVNATRWALYKALCQTGLPVEVGTGGRTKYNRQRLRIPKEHALDAACVGDVDDVIGWETPTLVVKATGRGSYKRTRLTAHGFPRGYLMRRKSVQGFQTGDMVEAIVLKGKKEGTWRGRIAIRASGYFDIQTLEGKITGVSYKNCLLTQKADGYGYHIKPTHLIGEGVREKKSR